MFVVIVTVNCCYHDVIVVVVVVVVVVIVMVNFVIMLMVNYCCCGSGCHCRCHCSVAANDDDVSSKYNNDIVSNDSTNMTTIFSIATKNGDAKNDNNNSSNKIG